MGITNFAAANPASIQTSNEFRNCVEKMVEKFVEEHSTVKSAITFVL